MNNFFKQIGWGGTIGLIGGGIGMLVGVLASFAGGIGAGIFGLIFCAGFVWIFWHFMFGPMFKTNKLLEIGEDAEATILSVAENGSSMQMGGAIPKAGVTLALEVKPKGKPSYKAQLDTFISMFEAQKYQPGNTIRVKFDPNKPQDVAIAEGTGAMQNYASNTPSPELTAELQRLVEIQNRLMKEGEDATGKITEMHETGITVNGDNPLVEVTLEVKTKAGETFTAKTKAAVVRASLFKFAVGKELGVKFDPKDHSVVTVSHT